MLSIAAMVAAEAAVTKVFFIAHLPTLGMTFHCLFSAAAIWLFSVVGAARTHSRDSDLIATRQRQSEWAPLSGPGITTIRWPMTAGRGHLQQPQVRTRLPPGPPKLADDGPDLRTVLGGGDRGRAAPLQQLARRAAINQVLRREPNFLPPCLTNLSG